MLFVFRRDRAVVLKLLSEDGGDQLEAVASGIFGAEPASVGQPVIPCHLGARRGESGGERVELIVRNKERGVRFARGRDGLLDADV